MELSLYEHDELRGQKLPLNESKLSNCKYLYIFTRLYSPGRVYKITEKQIFNLKYD